MMTPQDNGFSQYRVARTWLRDNPNPFFCSFASLEWFIRQNRKELIESGELLVRRGSVGTLIGPGFERVVLDIMKRKSAEHVEHAPPRVA